MNLEIDKKRRQRSLIAHNSYAITKRGRKKVKNHWMLSRLSRTIKKFLFLWKFPIYRFELTYDDICCVDDECWKVNFLIESQRLWLLSHFFIANHKISCFFVVFDSWKFALLNLLDIVAPNSATPSPSPFIIERF